MSTSNTDILDEIQAAQSTKTGPGSRCRTKNILQSLSDKDRDGLNAALEDPNYQHVVIVDVLKRRGFEISESALRRHRLHQCACGGSSD